MSGYKRIAKEIKDQVLQRVKEGIPVAKLSEEHGISTKTIYTWISKASGAYPSLLGISKLKRENEVLLRLVGELMLKQKKGEKS